MVFRLDATEDYIEKTAKLPEVRSKFRIISAENKDDFIYVDRKTGNEHIGTRTIIEAVKLENPHIGRPVSLVFNVEHSNEFVSSRARADLQEFLGCFVNNRREASVLSNNLTALKDRLFEADISYRLNSDFPTLKNFTVYLPPKPSMSQNPPVYQQMQQPTAQQYYPQEINQPILQSKEQNPPIYQDSIPPQSEAPQEVAPPQVTKDGIPF